jgi:ABC-type phosphate/phosphonate transport system substrate-binding protein
VRPPRYANTTISKRSRRIEEKVAAGAISNDDYAGLDEMSKAGLAVLAESASVPRHLVSVRRNLPEAVIKRLKEILLSMDQDDEGQKILRQTDGTTKFDALPGGEEAFRRKLNDLYHLRGEKNSSPQAYLDFYKVWDNSKDWW